MRHEPLDPCRGKGNVCVHACGGAHRVVMGSFGRMARALMASWRRWMVTLGTLDGFRSSEVSLSATQEPRAREAVRATTATQRALDPADGPVGVPHGVGEVQRIDECVGGIQLRLCQRDLVERAKAVEESENFRCCAHGLGLDISTANTGSARRTCRGGRPRRTAAPSRGGIRSARECAGSGRRAWGAAGLRVPHHRPVVAVRARCLGTKVEQASHHVLLVRQ